ncbi:hypothetical protein NOV72_02622 [Caballeronia novacaledonica]|uniref:Tox-REase-5 domain-containing protein n=1 Tax=Caballeronia novacaledonica TaxID=1544861 RepID=A0A2U3I5G4_9BURK|nr:restriction endonuclease fold toxin 5 domain-containing protein [Caballeronia novacaledonica]SPB15396.1 hypothetical protein NOV72_02622 [Caballeronia novacaledonica]
MAALAIPVLEAAAEGIAALWAALTSSSAVSAVAGGAATGAILSLPGDTAKDKDKAQTDTQVKVRTRERECKCPPDRGQMAPVNHAMSDLSAQYQQFVTGFPKGQEWIFSEKDFDGFQSGQCLLQEAKARYDQFFDEVTGQPKFFFAINEKKGFPKMKRQAKAQSDIVTANQPSKLQWYFMQPMSWRYATKEFGRAGFRLTTELKPLG